MMKREVRVSGKSNWGHSPPNTTRVKERTLNPRRDNMPPCVECNNSRRRERTECTEDRGDEDNKFTMSVTVMLGTRVPPSRERVVLERCSSCRRVDKRISSNKVGEGRGNQR